MKLKYTIKGSTDNPIMLLDRVIGQSEDEDRYIDGSDFSKELIYLDSLGKESITIYINTIGGLLIDAMQIFNTIKLSKTKIITHNIGLAASGGALIFLSGDEKIMNDYSIIMLHEAQGTNDNNNEAYQNAVSTMMEVTGLDRLKIEQLIEKETWITVNDSEYNGVFWDKVNESNKQDVEIQHNADISKITNKANKFIINLKKNSKMEAKIKELLKLESEATESDVINSIEKLLEASNDKIDITPIMDKLNSIEELIEVSNEIKTEDKVEQVENKVEENKEENKEKVEEKVGEKVDEKVENKVKKEPVDLKKLTVDNSGHKTMASMMYDIKNKTSRI